MAVALTGTYRAREAPAAVSTPGTAAHTRPDVIGRAAFGTARGFTLLEVLVVVLIIGVVLGIASLGFSRDVDDRLQTEAERFAALVTLAAQESVLQAKEYAVIFDDRGYSFFAREGDEWIEAEDRVFRRRELPEDFYLDVVIEGRDLDVAQKEQEDPRIFLLSSGEMTPFELIFRHEHSNAAYRVRGEIGGQLELGA